MKFGIQKSALCLLAVGLCLSWSCTFTEKIRDGRTAYERKRYFQAVEMLMVEFEQVRSNLDRMNIAYLLGESYQKFGAFKEASDWYKTAYEGGYGPSALVGQAITLKQLEQYREAASAFAKAGDEIGDRVRFRQEVAGCLQAAEWKADEKYSPFRIRNLRINTASSDYAAIPVSNNEIAFTSDREQSVGEYKYAWTGNNFSDLYLANLSDNKVNSLATVPDINLEDNEGTTVWSPDGTKMVFCRCFSRGEYDVFCKLMLSEKKENSWTKPEILPFVKDGFNYRQPAFSADGSLLVFSANLDEATNDYDLYFSRLVDGVWQQPVSMGTRINTQKREAFPYFDKDTLYFSSDVTGMGGLDIFRTYPDAKGQWVFPVNLRAPVNSGGDDFGFVINSFFTTTDSVLQHGYFSSNREGGQGSDDIYEFKKVKYHPVKPEPKREFLYEIVLDLRVFQKQYQDPNDPDSRVIMRIPLSDAKISIQEDGLNFRETASNQFGILSLNLNPDKEYNFFVSHEGFFNNELIFSTKNLTIDSTKKIQKFEERILLDKIFYDREIVLENIYYDLDESFIRDDAKPTLDSLASLLKINPMIKIQMSSHTDCRASDDYNLRLSQARADSAISYLMEKGIDQQRLTAVGYGETLLAVQCICEQCTEEEHQANRRTTFKVIK